MLRPSVLATHSCTRVLLFAHLINIAFTGAHLMTHLMPRPPLCLSKSRHTHSAEHEDEDESSTHSCSVMHHLCMLCVCVWPTIQLTSRGAACTSTSSCSGYGVAVECRGRKARQSGGSWERCATYNATRPNLGTGIAVILLLLLLLHRTNTQEEVICDKATMGQFKCPCRGRMRHRLAIKHY